MTKCAQEIFKALDLLESACRAIQDYDRCDDCPLKYMCLDGQYGTTTVTELADLMNASSWDEFLDFADNCIPSEELAEEMRYADEADRGRDELPDED